MIKTQSQQYRY